MNRKITKSDLPELKNVLDHCDLFPAEYLDDMISPYFTEENDEDIWFTTEHDGKLVSIAFAAPMQFTNGTYNLYAIGVHEDFQGQGVGRSMLHYLESELKTRSERLLIIETSSTPAQEAARHFYLNNGYTQEATIRDFWDEGDHKILFWKKLD